MSFSSTLINQTNSNSYADLLGLQLGITRFIGEDNYNFLQRLYEASSRIKDSSIQGLINNVCSNLDLEVYLGIKIETVSLTPISVTPGVVTVGTNVVNLFSLAPDTYITWIMLSDVVATLNTFEGITATLLSTDFPAFCIPTQTNSTISLNENVVLKGLTYTVQNAGLISGSELFNSTPPAYTISGDVITFSSTPPSGLQITYQSIVNSYSLVVSDVGVVSLSDTKFIALGTNSANVLGYQIREALQEIMSADRSYWAR